MLDINFIKNNLSLVKESVENRNLSDLLEIDDLIELHNSYLKSLQFVESKRNERNQLSEQIAKASKEERQNLIENATNVKEEIKYLENELVEKEKKYTELLKQVPNILAEDVPVGKDDADNLTIKEWGEKRDFDFEIKDHIDLGTELDLIDVETAAKVTGSRFYYLKNEAVLIQQAIINMVYETLTNEETVKKIAKSVGNDCYKTFTPVLPPLFIKAPVMDRMARLHPIDDRYYYEKDDIVLIGSAEHTLGPMHMDKTFNHDELPLRYIGFSSAFRRESGTYGKDTRGIFRVHQFDKLEMESFSTVEHGPKEQDLIIAIQEYLVKQLELPYRLVYICTGDMGKPDYKQIDINCWIPSQNTYRETHTSDYMTDYQSRRLGTAYKSETGERLFVYMNDATAFAIPRILIALLENNQQKDGSITIPKALRKYLGFKTITPKK